jgi:ParB family chromosome partitioning protein
LQPITVRPVEGNRYMIVAGECRYRAHKLLVAEGKLPDGTVKAIVHDVDDREMALLAIIENAKRKDVNPIEEANAYQSLIDAGYDSATIAAEVSVSVGVVNARLALLKLDTQGQTLVRAGQLSATIAARSPRPRPGSTPA